MTYTVEIRPAAARQLKKLTRVVQAQVIQQLEELELDPRLPSDRIVINLKSGATYSFPPALAQGLAGASPEDLAEVEVTPSGDGLHWEKLDADFSVPALLAGVFGTAAWMAQIKMKAS